jgi:hypothetical protein
MKCTQLRPTPRQQLSTTQLATAGIQSPTPDIWSSAAVHRVAEHVPRHGNGQCMPAATHRQVHCVTKLRTAATHRRALCYTKVIAGSNAATSTSMRRLPGMMVSAEIPTGCCNYEPAALQTITTVSKLCSASSALNPDNNCCGDHCRLQGASHTVHTLNLAAARSQACIELWFSCRCKAEAIPTELAAAQAPSPSHTRRCGNCCK